MKPFRIYEVVAGGLTKWYKPHIKHDYKTLEECHRNICNYITINKQAGIRFNNKQWVIQEYTGKNNAKIVKVIDSI